MATNVVPVGTQVVLERELRDSRQTVLFPKGAVGMIVRSPVDHTHAYRVRFPDGREETVHRSDFDVLRHFKAGELSGQPVDFSVRDCIIYACVVGSQAFGLAGPESDADRRGIYLPPAEQHWSLYGVPEQVEDPQADECYWELQKFLVLALKANPNILECLYTPLVEYADPIAQELLAMRDAFLSRLVYQTYNGYALSQFRKIEQDVRNHGTVRWKHAMHLIRLLHSGIRVLREGTLILEMPEHRDLLLAIRQGELAWEEVDAMRRSLHAEFDRALPESLLPERPDYERVNAFLIQARRSRVEASA